MTDDNTLQPADESIQHNIIETQCRERVAQGATQDEIIIFMHAQGLDADTAIRLFSKMFGGAFWGNAPLFQNHSEWREDVEEMVELTNAFLEGISSDEGAIEKLENTDTV